MPDSIVSCHGCEAKLVMRPDQPAVRCPKCGSVVRATAYDVAPPEPMPERPKTPAEEYDERAARRRRERKQEAEDMDVEALLREKAPPPDTPDEGPWGTAAGVGAGVFAVTFLGTLAAFGTRGFSNDDRMLLALLIFFAGGFAAMIWGVNHVRTRVIHGKYGIKTTGGTAVANGFMEVIGGALVAGFTGYGLVFRYINWAFT